MSRQVLRCESAWLNQLVTAVAIFLALLAYMLAFADASPAVPTNGKIAYEYWPDGLDCGYMPASEIRVMNADGTDSVSLTGLGANLSPDWSPDGSKIAWSGPHSYLYVINADGSGTYQLTGNPSASWDANPEWSPDGSKVAFSSSRVSNVHDVNIDIYVINADGTGETRLSVNEAIDRNPSWSPDGSKIAFFSDRDSVGDDTNTEIYVMNADGTGETRLTDDPADDEDPDWSPDGSRIAFQSNQHDGKGFEIFTMNADGSEPMQITTNVGLTGATDPEWSPDGSMIAYGEMNHYCGRGEIHTINADGSGERNLTPDSYRTPFDSRNPSWQVGPPAAPAPSVPLAPSLAPIPDAQESVSAAALSRVSLRMRCLHAGKIRAKRLTRCRRASPLKRRLVVSFASSADAAVKVRVRGKVRPKRHHRNVIGRTILSRTLDAKTGDNSYVLSMPRPRPREQLRATVRILGGGQAQRVRVAE